MDEQIRKLLKRFEKLEEMLGHADVLSDQKQYRELAQEHAYLSEVKDLWQRLERLKKQLEENLRALDVLAFSDDELAGLASRAFAHHWVDAEMREGKRGGALPFVLRRQGPRVRRLQSRERRQPLDGFEGAVAGAAGVRRGGRQAECGAGREPQRSGARQTHH